MGKVLEDTKGNILIFTESEQEHYRVLEEVLKKVEQAGVRINPEKCYILKKEVKYLGRIINKDGIQTDPSKLEAINSFQRPKCIKGLRSFLGICNYSTLQKFVHPPVK